MADRTVNPISLTAAADELKLIEAAMLLAGTSNRSRFIVDCVMAQIKGTLVESLASLIGRQQGFEISGKNLGTKITLIISVGQIAESEGINVTDFTLDGGSYTLVIDAKPEELVPIIRKLHRATLCNPSVRILGNGE